jgi:hypothetical protein
VDGAIGCSTSSVTCLVGANRYVTATLLAEEWFGGANGFGLATGQNYPDALAMAPLLGQRDWPLLLVPSDGPLPTSGDGSVRELLQDRRASLLDGAAAGGTAALSRSVVADACSAAQIARCDVSP